MRSLDTSRPFTRAAGLAAGLTDRQLGGPRFRRIFPGIYVSASAAPTPLLRVEAALLLVDGDAFASHVSAARVWGVAVPTIAEEHVTVPTPEKRRSRREVRCHVGEVSDVAVRLGLRVSAPERMFVELAQRLGLIDLVVVGDDLVRRGLSTPARLVEFCGHGRLPAVDAARRAAGFVREDVDSPMETRLRMLVVLAGLPEPEVNLTIRDVDGQPVRRYDLSWPKVRLIVEYDGRHHAERERQWEDDVERRNATSQPVKDRSSARSSTRDSPEPRRTQHR